MTTPLVPYAGDPKATVEKGPWDISCAPKNNQHLRLLVVFEEVSSWDDDAEGVHPMAQVDEDGDAIWTLGSNGYEDDDIDQWRIVGWNWESDFYTSSQGVPVAWLHFVPETEHGAR